MMQHLPTTGCKWLTQDKIKKCGAKTIHGDNKDGCILDFGLKQVQCFAL